MSRYQFIAAHRADYPVRRLCQVLLVTPSRYYAWCQGQQVRAVKGPAWELALLSLFARHKSRYGTRRLRVALQLQGHRVGRQALRTAMHRQQLRALQPKAYTPRTTDSTHGLRCAPNHLLDRPPVVQANRVMVPPGRHLGSATSPICPWPVARGRTYAPSKTWLASTSLAGR